MTRIIDGRLAGLRTRGRLPHLEVRGATYFVTFRAADAVTPTANHASRTLVDPVPIAEISEPPLTAGACVLARPEVGGLVADALRHFRGSRYLLGSWCVMPNHVHALVAPLGEVRLRDILHSWKSYTANRIQQMVGGRGRFWEREYFDHMVRTDTALQQFADYIEWNPVLAGLCARPEDWPLGSAAARAMCAGHIRSVGDDP